MNSRHDDVNKDDGETKGAHVILKVTMQPNIDVTFRIKRNTPLSRLINDYCKRLNLDPKFLRFSCKSVKVDKDQTADELKLEDGDVIHAWIEQNGGGVVAAPIFTTVI